MTVQQAQVHGTGGYVRERKERDAQHALAKSERGERFDAGGHWRDKWIGGFDADAVMQRLPRDCAERAGNPGGERERDADYSHWLQRLCLRPHGESGMHTDHADGGWRAATGGQSELQRSSGKFGNEFYLYLLCCGEKRTGDQQFEQRCELHRADSECDQQQRAQYRDF